MCSWANNGGKYQTDLQTVCVSTPQMWSMDPVLACSARHALAALQASTAADLQEMAGSHSVPTVQCQWPETGWTHNRTNYTNLLIAAPAVTLWGQRGKYQWVVELRSLSWLGTAVLHTFLGLELLMPKGWKLLGHRQPSPWFLLVGEQSQATCLSAAASLCWEWCWQHT